MYGYTPNEDLQIRWDWDGNGTWDTPYDKIKTISHQYTAPGSYLVALEVKNNAGLLAAKTKMVITREGTFTDDRDWHEYSLVTIGTQTWMAENLAFLPSVGTTTEGLGFYVYGFFGRDVSKAKSTDKYADYGVLYNWPAAKMACPASWHLPIDKEWITLTSYLGSSAAVKMKGPSVTAQWSPRSDSANASGFTALPGGSSYSESIDLGSRAYFWSASSYPDGYDQNAWMRNLGISTGLVRNWSSKSLGYSVRCIKNGHTPPTASFTFNPPIGTTSTIFQFDASGCEDLETKAMIYWYAGIGMAMESGIRITKRQKRNRINVRILTGTRSFWR